MVLAGIVRDKEFWTRSTIGHDTGDGNTKAIVINDCGLTEGDSTYCLSVGKNVDEANVSGIIYPDMNRFLIDTLSIGLANAVPSHAAAYPIEAHQRLDDQINQLARLFAHKRRTSSVGARCTICFRLTLRSTQLTVADDIVLACACDYSTGAGCAMRLLSRSFRVNQPRQPKQAR